MIKMKRLAIIWKLLLVPAFTFAQAFTLDNIAIKCDRVDVYYMEGKECVETQTYGTKALFYFDEGVITTTTLYDQLKSFYFMEHPISGKLGNYDGYGFYAKDNGGFRCTFNVIYVPETDTYGIRIDYNNVRFFFEGDKTSERLWDNEPTYVDEMIDEQNEYPLYPEYTDEEVDTFLNQFGNGKLIKAAIIKQFILDNSEY